MQSKSQKLDALNKTKLTKNNFFNSSQQNTQMKTHISPEKQLSADEDPHCASLNESNGYKLSATLQVIINRRYYPLNQHCFEIKQHSFNSCEAE